jgi:hypothetical protein
MVMIKSTPDTEAGILPSEELLTAMGKYNQELVDAGVLVDGAGLHPSSQGAKVRFTSGKSTVIDGPFTESKELIAGYWTLEVESLQEAIDWVKRAPSVEGVDGEFEIRRVFSAEDFGEEYTPELREQEERMRAQVAEQRSK